MCALPLGAFRHPSLRTDARGVGLLSASDGLDLLPLHAASGSTDGMMSPGGTVVGGAPSRAVIGSDMISP